MRSAPIVLVLAFAMAGCVGTDADQALDAAGDASHSEPVRIEEPISLDLVLPFYVYYSTVSSDHCASEMPGPILHVDVTATWEASDPTVPDTLELRVYNGTRGKEVVRGHQTEDGHPIAAEEGTSSLTLIKEVEAGNTVRLRVCQWDNLVVPGDFDVHLEGYMQYTLQLPAAT